jgi:hypothetical protein
MLSKNIYMPYFYIIRHKETGKQYAGSRWAKGCHPSEFMQKGGYTTSSIIINSIIEREGVDVFEIIEIITLDELIIPFSVQSVYQYETWFLNEYNCATSPDWYNKHNNEGMVFGTAEFYDKSKTTCLEKYGYEYCLQAPEIQEKSKQTLLDNYGVDSPAKNEEILNRMKDTNIKKYGVEFPLQSDVIKENTKLTNLERYGYEYGLQSPIIKEKSKQTCLEVYGVDHPSKDPEIKERIFNTFKKTNLEKYGVEFHVNIQVTCPYCNKIGNKPIMMRWHFNNCKLKT